MLKLIRGVILSLVVLVASAYVPPTYAASASIVITQIQAGGSGAALEELVVLYNNSAEDIDISNWCLRNKGNVKFACFTPSDSSDSFILPSYHFATVASSAFATFMSPIGFSVVYPPTNQSSGSIVGGSDTISLLNSSGGVVDAHSWSVSLLGGMLYARSLFSISPLTYIDTDSSSDWIVDSPQFIPDSEIEHRPVVEDSDLCPNLDGIQTVLPEDYEVGTNGDCRAHLYSLFLSEVLPNAVGSDSGREFIELYNPNDVAVDLGRYLLLVGPALDKSYTFPEGAIIEPLSYLSFTNDQIAFSLLNTSSSVRLLGDGETLDETTYIDPGDDMSWTFLDGAWGYTNRPTSSAENIPSGDRVVKSATTSSSEPKPCADNQVRSPETNRCRLIETPPKQTPCKDGQYRSEETNRCRNIASETAGPAPCEEGQERNPETNRCRIVKKVSNVDYAVLGAQTSSDSNRWYVWAAIALLILAILGYGVWEWRFELAKFLRRFARTRK